MSFVEPKKVVNTEGHLKQWTASEAYRRLTSFIEAIGDAVVSKKVSERSQEPSKAVKRFLDALDRVEAIIDETPPVDVKGRFGNPSFREFHHKLQQVADDIVGSLLDGAHKGALIELKPYFLDSFGNAKRIDYGSGHELAFVALLCCCGIMRIFKPEDSSNICLHIFHRYLQVVRHLQLLYRLEPAGSHGVWGLDDYQFLCYYWGAAQLIGQQEVTPNSIPDEATAERLGDEYFFFDAIRFIFKVKSGPFFEHSRMLFDISGVATWTKVRSGLMKMYVAEVLNKLPVMQHFYFGYLLPIDLGTQRQPIEASAIAATEGEEGGRLQGNDQPFMSASDFGPTWGGPVPVRSSSTDSVPGVVDPADAVIGAGPLPMTAFPSQGGIPGAGPAMPPHGSDSLPVAATRTGGARVAERGSLRPRNTS